MKDDAQIRPLARALLANDDKNIRKLVEKMVFFYDFNGDVAQMIDVIDRKFMPREVAKKISDHNSYRKEYEKRKYANLSDAKEYAVRYLKYIPSTPRNYFNTDSLYHLNIYYRRLAFEFAQVEAKVAKEKGANRKSFLTKLNNSHFDLLNADGFIDYVGEKYYAKPSAKNLFFVSKDLDFNTEKELSNYKSISRLQAEKETKDKTIWKNVPAEMEAFMSVEYALSVKNAKGMSDSFQQKLFLTVMRKHRNMIDSLEINNLEKSKLRAEYLERYPEFDNLITELRGETYSEEDKFSASASIYEGQILLDENGYPLTFDKSTGAFINVLGELSWHAYNDEGVVVYDHEPEGLGNDKLPVDRFGAEASKTSSQDKEMAAENVKYAALTDKETSLREKKSAREPAEKSTYFDCVETLIRE